MALNPIYFLHDNHSLLSFFDSSKRFLAYNNNCQLLIRPNSMYPAGFPAFQIRYPYIFRDFRVSGMPNPVLGGRISGASLNCRGQNLPVFMFYKTNENFLRKIFLEKFRLADQSYLWMPYLQKVKCICTVIMTVLLYKKNILRLIKSVNFSLYLP